MSILKELPPTAGWPLYARDFLATLSLPGFTGSLEEDFKNYLSVAYARVTYSGTAAFYIILESLKEISDKKTVIIPSFICPLVPLAIKRAGLKIEVCDIQKDNFNFDMPRLQQLCLENKDILAIIATHLGGLPLDFSLIQPLAQENKIFIIEDCAQALGAEYRGKKVGTLGEFSFFSLCRGKGLTIYEGGLITTNKKEYTGVLNRKIRQVEKADFFSETLKILELFGYWLFYRPRLFWFAFRLPQIFWNWRGENLKALNEYFEINFPLHAVSRMRKSIGHVTFPRLTQEVSEQRKKAAKYIGGLLGSEGIKLIMEANQDKASYPYLTLLFDDPKRRDLAKETLEKTGLGISQIYAMAITDYSYLNSLLPKRECPNARYLAEREITLTTSRFLKDADIEFIIQQIKGL